MRNGKLTHTRAKCDTYFLDNVNKYFLPLPPTGFIGYNRFGDSCTWHPLRALLQECEHQMLTVTSNQKTLTSNQVGTLLSCQVHRVSH